jgi:hypothetical protein
MTKSMEDYKVTLDRVAIAAKWDENLMFARMCKGSAACSEVLKEVDEALEKVREQEAAETRLKIMEGVRDKLSNLADTVHEEAEDKTHEELIELSEEIFLQQGQHA